MTGTFMEIGVQGSFKPLNLEPPFFLSVPIHIQQAFEYLSQHNKLQEFCVREVKSRNIFSTSQNLILIYLVS